MLSSRAERRRTSVLSAGGKAGGKAVGKAGGRAGVVAYSVPCFVQDKSELLSTEPNPIQHNTTPTPTRTI